MKQTIGELQRTLEATKEQAGQYAVLAARHAQQVRKLLETDAQSKAQIRKLDIRSETFFL